MSRRTEIALWALMTLALLAAGCSFDSTDLAPDAGTQSAYLDEGDEAVCRAACQQFVETQTCAYSHGGGGLATISVSDSCLAEDAVWNEAECAEACVTALSAEEGPLEPSVLPRLRSLLDCTSACDDCAYCEACGQEASALLDFVRDELGGEVERSEDLACGPRVGLSSQRRESAAMLPLSAVPLVARNGELQRECQLGPDDTLAGLELAFVWEGAPLATRCGGETDQDLSVMPGDYVETLPVVIGDGFSADSLVLDIACVDASPSTEDAECGGLSNPSTAIAQLAWKNHQGVGAPTRCEPAAVAVLIDQSGSMSGFANADLDWQEDVHGSFVWPSDEERLQRASDPQRHRIGAAQELIARLNTEDRLVVFSYQEKDETTELQVLCTGTPEPASGVLADKTEVFRKAVACFGTERAPIVDALALAYGEEEGRTPLWNAVLEAYEFLRDPSVAAPANRHLVVIGDGPDTCNAGSDEFVTGRPQCSESSYEEVRDHILATNVGAGSLPVHIHFIQMQAWGYPERDPRQQELACLTGGHHLFIDGFDMPRSEGTPELAEALEAAVERIRYAFAGHWSLSVQVPAFLQEVDAADALPPGSLYAVSGALTLLAGDFASQDEITPFGASGSSLAGAWDQRLWFRHRCTEDEQCEGTAQAVCAEQQGLCFE